MPLEVIPPVAAGAGGSILGAIIAWLGIKTRLESIEKKLETLVGEKECIARTTSMTQRIDNSVARFNKIDANIDVITKLLLDERVSRKKGD